MEALFASPLFTGCAGQTDIERTRPGQRIYQDELYWSFLFGATAGPRLEEIGQIRLDDIEELSGKEGGPIVARNQGQLSSSIQLRAATMQACSSSRKL